MMSSNEFKLIVQLGIKISESRSLSLKEIEQFLDRSTRTTHRYIDILRKDFHAPIRYDWHSNTYSCSNHWDIIHELKK